MALGSRCRCRILLRIVKRVMRVGPNWAIWFGERSQPFGEVLANGHQAAGSGFGLTLFDFNDAFVKAHVRPIEALDLGGPQPGKPADSQRWKELRVGGPEQCVESLRRVDLECTIP